MVMVWIRCKKIERDIRWIYLSFMNSFFYVWNNGNIMINIFFVEVVIEIWIYVLVFLIEIVDL